MFRATAVLLRRVKTSTGIVGLPVRPHGRDELIQLYKKTLEDIPKILAPEVFYRTAVEAITKHRLSVCEQNTDFEKIEELINCGQIEELIDQAENEYELMHKYAEWRLYEPPPMEGEMPPLPELEKLKR